MDSPVGDSLFCMKAVPAFHPSGHAKHVCSEAMHTLIINIDDTDGTSLAALTLNYTVDASLPVASVVPSNNSRITGNESIVITLNESVDATTLSASGSIWVNSDNGVWSMASSPSDTLTINPAGVWPAGAIDLVLDVDDLTGNSLATLILAYTVDVTPPNGTASPTSAGILSSVKDIIITFNESMEALSHSYSNSLAAVVGSSNWSTTINTNDTLAISSSSAWTIGSQALDVTATDVAGNTVTINLIYTVQSGTCSDGVQNQDETDVDCGGGVCGACSDGGACGLNSDCISTDCFLNICRAAICGNLAVQPGETCDDGNNNACGTCDSACLLIQPGGDVVQVWAEVPMCTALVC